MSIRTLGILITLSLLGACTNKVDAQREISTSKPMEVLSLKGTLSTLNSCIQRSGADVSVSQSGKNLYVVPNRVVAEIKVTQTAQNSVKVEHRAYARTLFGSPYGWEYLELVKKCVNKPFPEASTAPVSNTQ